MLTLLRRDEVFGSLGLWLVNAGLMTSALFALYFWLRLTTTAVSPLQPLLLVVWLSLAVYLLFGNVRTRGSHLDLTLPASTHRLWLAHVIAVTVSGTGLVAIAIATISLHGWLLRGSPEAMVSELELLALVVHLVAGLVLAVVLIESKNLELHRVAFGVPDLLWRLLVVAAVATISLLLSALPLAFGLFPLGLACAVGFLTWKRLPPALSLFPSRPITPELSRRRHEGAGADEWVGLDRAAVGSRRTPHLFVIVHGVRWGAVTPWVTFPWVVLAGALAAGVLSIWAPLEDIRFWYIPLYIYMLFMSVPAVMEQLAHLDPWPISRRRLFAVMVLPALAAFLFGYGVGWLGLRSTDASRDLIEYRASPNDPHFYLYVPIGRNEIAWDGEAPAITAPWGESHPAWTAPLFAGSTVHIYSRFHTPEGSSLRFVAWQISRAVKAIYGRRIPPAEIQERYLEVRGDIVALRGEKLPLLTDYPDLEPLSAGPLFLALTLLTVIPWLLVVALYAAAFRAGISDWVRKALWIGLLVAALGIIAGTLALAVAQVMEPWASRGLIEILIRKLGTTSWGVALAWLVSVGCLLGAYRLAEGVFRRAELPAKPTIVKVLQQ